MRLPGPPPPIKGLNLTVYYFVLFCTTPPYFCLARPDILAVSPIFWFSGLGNGFSCWLDVIESRRWEMLLSTLWIDNTALFWNQLILHNQNGDFWTLSGHVSSHFSSWTRRKVERYHSRRHEHWQLYRHSSITWGNRLFLLKYNKRLKYICRIHKEH